MTKKHCNITLYATDKAPKMEVIYDTPISVTVWINSEPMNNVGELAKTQVAADYLRVIQDMRVMSCSIDGKIPPNVVAMYTNAARSTFLAYTKEDMSVDVMPRSSNDNVKNTDPRYITEDEKFVIISKMNGRTVNTVNKKQNIDSKSADIKVASDSGDEIAVNIVVVKMIENRVTPPILDCKNEKQWRKLRNFIRSNCGFLIKEKERLRLIASAIQHQMQLKKSN